MLNFGQFVPAMMSLHSDPACSNIRLGTYRACDGVHVRATQMLAYCIGELQLTYK